MLNHGVLAVLLLVFPEFEVAVLIEAVRVHSVTCVAEVECSHLPEYGDVGIVK